MARLIKSDGYVQATLETSSDKVEGAEGQNLNIKVKFSYDGDDSNYARREVIKNLTALSVRIADLIRILEAVEVS